MRIILVLVIFIPFLNSANEIKETTESIIQEKFGGGIEISYTKYQISPKVKTEIEIFFKQRFFSENVFVWTIKKNDTLIAIGIMDNVYGKAQPITFITLFNMDGEILSNHIVKYREEHGGAVANKNWNEKFVGMNKNSNFSEIDGISGATISVNSIKKGVAKLSLLFDKINFVD